MERTGKQVVEALVATLNAGEVAGMDEVFRDDAVIEWPQSGERIVGAANRRAIYGAFPQLPSIAPRRLTGDGDLWVLEADLDYGDGDPYQSIFIFDVTDGLIAKETAYWSRPFPAPDWRAQWVERI